MAIQLLSRLRSEIDAAGTKEDRLALRAQWAGVVARYGKFDDARREIRALRAENSNYEPRVTAWILVAEGLADHFESLSQFALDKFRRAYAIGIAAGLSEIQGVSAAWMAASEFLAGSVLAAAAHAVEAILVSDTGSDSARSRSHLVVADCLSCAGDFVGAQTQYAAARLHASRDGDISMQSVVLFNAAAFHVAGVALADALDLNSVDSLRSVELEVNSVANLDGGLGIDSLRALVPLLKAQLCVAQKSWSSACSLYDEALPAASSQGQDRWLAKFHADLAYCKAQIGDRQGAADSLVTAEKHLPACSDLDDLAIAHARIANTLRSLGLTHESEPHLEAANRCYGQFKDQQLRLRTSLEESLQRLPR